MSFLNEKQSKNYFLFLCSLCLLLIFFGFYCGGRQTQKAQSMLYLREKTMVSSLLERGVAAEDIAAALKNEETTKEASLFLTKLGHTESTPAFLLPSLFSFTLSLLSLLLPGLFLFCLLLLAGSVFFMQSLESLYQRAAAVISCFAEGDFGRRLPRNGRGTLYRLFDSINQLSLTLQVKIGDEHKAKEFLKDIVSDISHQLKTPLSALTMYTEIILAEPGNSRAVKEFSKKSMQSLERMEALILSLLKIMRLDAGSIIFEKTPCPIADLISHGAQELLIRAQAENKQLLWDNNTKETVSCDFEWTSQAIGNLIKNALDYTPSGGLIKISAESSPLMLRLFITDNGCGIGPEDIHHIFKRFYRSQNSKNTNGIGLGLPLAKKIIEEQGGILSVRSIPGEGTTFIVSFLTKL